LKYFPSKDVEELLIQGLKDSFWKVRVNAAESLGELVSKEAVEILDFLLKRNEITKDFYDELYFRITQEKDGLKRLINECGGFKKPGYYEKKFYKKKA